MNALHQPSSFHSNPSILMRQQLSCACPALLALPAPVQCTMKREAAESSIEQQLRDKEAIEAENAAALARIAQNEAAVSGSPQACQCRFTCVWCEGCDSAELRDGVCLRVISECAASCCALGVLTFCNTGCAARPAQMRTLREKLAALRQGHEAQIQGVLEQFGALRQQVCVSVVQEG